MAVSPKLRRAETRSFNRARLWNRKRLLSHYTGRQVSASSSPRAGYFGGGFGDGAPKCGTEQRGRPHPFLERRWGRRAPERDKLSSYYLQPALHSDRANRKSATRSARL